MLNQNKTVLTSNSVSEYLNNIQDLQRQKDCKTIAALMNRLSAAEPKMWGTSIVGFGFYHYKYPSGREGDFMQIGFSNRKNAITLYIMSGFSKYPELMEKLGKYKTGKSCLYIKQLSDVDLSILESLISESLNWLRNKFPN